MNVTVTCRGFEGESGVGGIKYYIENSIEKHISQYFKGLKDEENNDSIRMHFVVEKELSYRFRVTITMHDVHGEFIRATDSANYPYAAVDLAVTRLSSKLRRYKGKIKKHRDKQHRIVKTYLLNIDEESKEDKSIKETQYNPAIIEESDIKLKTMSVSEAAMDMDLLGVPALLFVNASTGQVNMVYVRNDGNIAWVDPAPN